MGGQAGALAEASTIPPGLAPRARGRGGRDRKGHRPWLRESRSLEPRFAPFSAAEENARPFLFIGTEGRVTEEHEEGKASHGHAGQDDVQSQQTHPKREEDGNRYGSFLTFFKVNARPRRRPPDSLPLAEEVWSSAELREQSGPCPGPTPDPGAATGSPGPEWLQMAYRAAVCAAGKPARLLSLPRGPGSSACRKMLFPVCHILQSPCTLRAESGATDRRCDGF
ncbi:hypothetical protein HJG60_010462 [Phyllostomus discolor]|uniref:Uncharacterized protein n=1 Tax=Phyllostomus discolor TaxID=89673 RepID=A0A834ANS7_9CHIR|nr:hypothetical protein HJG60_010462 [Phyllostomus discolor]